MLLIPNSVIAVRDPKTVLETFWKANSWESNKAQLTVLLTALALCWHGWLPGFTVSLRIAYNKDLPQSHTVHTHTKLQSGAGLPQGIWIQKKGVIVQANADWNSDSFPFVKYISSKLNAPDNLSPQGSRFVICHIILHTYDIENVVKYYFHPIVQQQSRSYNEMQQHTHNKNRL